LGQCLDHRISDPEVFKLIPYFHTSKAYQAFHPSKVDNLAPAAVGR
jgi:hypothetical protein